MATPAFRSSTYTSQTAGTSLAVTTPAGVAVGDLLLAVVSISEGRTATAPAGWSLLRTDNTLLPGFSNFTQQVFTRTVTASEPPTHTFTISASAVSAAHVAAYSAEPYVAVHGATAVTDGSVSSSVVAPSVTLPGDDHLLVGVFFLGGANTNFSPPLGMTANDDDYNGTSSSRMSRLIASRSALPGGETGTQTAVATASGTEYRIGILIGLAATNHAPNAPTGLSPSGSTTIDRSAARRFSWTFSDPDAGDTQSKYDLRYRLTTSGTWTTVSGTTPNQFHDFAGGTFAAGDYEWQVRTYDAQGLVGPYTSSAFFTAADSPGGPSITDPISGQTISEESYTVVWSTPSQESFQVRTVADSAGFPDTATVYTDSGEVVSSSARSYAVAFATNGRTEHVQVRVKTAGLWSVWSSVNVDVSYTAPQTPTVAVDETTVAGAVLVQASHPTPAAGQPTVTSVDIFRRVTADGGDGIRIAADAVPTVLYTDYAVASGVEYGWRVRAYGDNGTSSWSAWSESPSVIDVYYGGAYA